MITKGNFYISVINLILYSSFLQPYHLPKCGMFTFYPSGWHWYYSLPHCFVNPYFSEVNWPPSPGSCSDFVPIKAIHLSMLFLITVFFLQVLLFILKLSLLPPASFSFDSPYFHVTCLQFQGFTYIRINYQTSQKLYIQLSLPLLHIELHHVMTIIKHQSSVRSFFLVRLLEEIFLAYSIYPQQNFFWMSYI